MSNITERYFRFAVISSATIAVLGAAIGAMSRCDEALALIAGAIYALLNVSLLALLKPGPSGERTRLGSLFVFMWALIKYPLLMASMYYFWSQNMHLLWCFVGALLISMLSPALLLGLAINRAKS